VPGLGRLLSRAKLTPDAMTICGRF
jgi:hypothetical protein